MNPYIDDNGSKYWLNQHGYHRDDGPAIEMKNGTKEWCVDGKLHRVDGPAVEYKNGNVYWWLHSICYTFEEWLERTPLSIEEKALLKLRYG